MHKFYYTSAFRPALAALTLAWLTACATTTSHDATPDARAQQRWDALLSEDYQGAYEYLSPGYRSSMSPVDYQRKLLLQRIRWTGAAFKQSDCLDNVCKVRISVEYKIRGALPGVPVYEGRRIIEEDWIRSGGQWWFVPEK